MPYGNEYAQYNSIRRLTENIRIKELLSKYSIFSPLKAEESLDDVRLVQRTTLEQMKKIEQPDYVLSIDGSYSEVSVAKGVTSAKVGYVTTTDVLLQLKKLQELDKERPVDPRILLNTRTSTATDTVLAGCNIIFGGEFDPKASFRKGIIDLFADQKAFDRGETLLDTYEALLAYKPVIPKQGCPYGEEVCQHKTPNTALDRASKTTECSCPLKLPHHSTDALRLYERFNPLGENGTAYGEVIHVTERLWLIHIIRSMEQCGLLKMLANTAIMLDGPLAVFGRPGWLSRAIMQELFRVNKLVKAETGKDMLLIGIEKSGVFVEHFEKLCLEQDSIPNGTALLPTNDYIRSRVVLSNNIHQYGDVNYFGRKFFYKTNTGARIVATLPFLKPEHRNLDKSELKGFPRLLDALTLFDSLYSSRYANALLPISLAHGEASIPKRLGNSILKVMAQDAIDN